VSDKDWWLSKAGLFARHPLTVVVVGFLLTGIVGTLVTRSYAERQAQQERRLALIEDRKEAIQTLASFVYERRARAEMVASALRRAAREQEILERKRLYDEAYVRWNTSLQSNLFKVRDILGDQQYYEFEQHIETLLVPIYRDLDVCINGAVDQHMSGERASPIMDTCDIKSLLQLALDCGYAITDELYKLTDVSFLEEEDLRFAWRQLASNEVHRRCTGVGP
jgi:hypothetical protein